ncbi:MAG: hypothetical protein QXG98_05735 [Candidatus Micrarchaeia archaeon]
MAVAKTLSAGALVARIVGALRNAGFSQSELRLVRGWLERALTRDAVLASGARSTLSIAGLSRQELAVLQYALERARERVSRGEQPFTPEERRRVEGVLRKALSVGAARRLAADIANSDEMVLTMLANSLREIRFSVGGTLAARLKRV